MTAGPATAVTVIVPTRNRLAWLRQCLASVLDQQAVRLDLVVIDDASSDGTAAWLATQRDSRLRHERCPTPVERVVARNRGLALARGRFVMFLDDDDWLQPQALQRLAGALARHADAVAAVGARRAVFEHEGYERRDAHPRRKPHPRRIFDELLFGWSAVSGQALYRTDRVRAVGGYEDPAVIPCEDRLLWLRLARLGPVVFVPETVVNFRYHAGNLKRPTDLQRRRDQVAHRVIRRLPRAGRGAALRLRRSGHLIEQAEDAMSSGHIARALLLALRSMALTPRIYASPLIGEWVLRRLAGRLVRYRFPPRSGGPPGRDPGA